MSRMHPVLKSPLITEKGTFVGESGNQVLFAVRPSASKEEIRQAVESFFQVKVEKVRTANFPGKRHRVGRNVGRRPAWKKAYVTLAQGQHIDFFENV